MKINFYSYEEASRISEKKKNMPWISIRDVGYEEHYSKINENSNNVCSLVFDDVDHGRVSCGMIASFYRSQYTVRKPVYFTEGMAEGILFFCLDNRELINIHCWAGISRSSAVAFVINNFFGDDDFEENYKKINNPEVAMNCEVIKVMTDVFYRRLK